MTRTLEPLIAPRGKPGAIRCDNGPELTSRHFLSWCEEQKIQLIHIPRKPLQNGHVESFHGRPWDECLNANWFRTLADARKKSALGETSTTVNGRTAVWATERQMSLQRH